MTDSQRDPHAITGTNPHDHSDLVTLIETALHNTPGLTYPDNLGARRLAQRLAGVVSDHHRRPPTTTSVLAETEPIRLLVQGLREAIQAARTAAAEPCASCGWERRGGAGNRVSDRISNEGTAA